MATYRYFTCDLLTNNVLSDLQLYGINFDKQVNGAGNFYGSFKLGTKVLNDAAMLSASKPGKTSLYVERNGKIIWGGIIWSRTYESQGKTAMLTGQTFESYFNRVVALEHIIQQSVEQVTIFKRIVDAMQMQDGSNIGLQFEMPIPDTAIPRTVLIPGYEFHYFQEAIDQLLNADDSFEYTIDVQPSSITDKPNKIIRVGNLKLNQDVTSMYFDYPGTVSQYWWPESTNTGGTKFAGRGYGTGNQAPTAIVIDGTKAAEGYPSIWRVGTYNNIADPNLLAAKTREDSVRFAIPVSSPTFMLKPDLANDFPGWNALGAPVTVRLQDERFPNGKVVQSRMLGWSLTPASSVSTEQLQFIMENNDDTDA